MILHEREGRAGHRLVLSGELDLNAGPRLIATVSGAVSSGVSSLELDLCEVTFIDSSGVRAILQARDECESHSAGLSLVPSSHPGPQRVFETLGLVGMLPWVEAGQQYGAGQPADCSGRCNLDA